MNLLRALLSASLVVRVAACATPQSAESPHVPPAAPLARAATSAPVVEDAPPPRPCGPLECLAFKTPGAAFDSVLSNKPRVLAVGEAHAQADAPGIPSSTRRFAEQLLPRLVGKSRHLVIELLLSHCATKTVQAVEAEQAPVTEPQAKGNQNQFVTLGKVAQRLGIEPQGLTPSCSEYDAAVASPDGGIAGLLRLIATQTETQVRALLREDSPANDLIVSYGGALHNDLYPRPGQEAWSFGPSLAAETNDRYLELDLIVPEFVKDSEAWRSLPWFSVFDRQHLPSETILYRPRPGSFVLIFPKTEQSAAEGR
jgi:hypothetical protein